jgi:hypothetical protein
MIEQLNLKSEQAIRELGEAARTLVKNSEIREVMNLGLQN